MNTACSKIKNPDAIGINKPKKPDKTVLYKIVKENLESFLYEIKEANPDSNPISAYAEKEFHKYLDCGILANGFARIRCDDCKEDYLIAFSCKSKSLCPSCNAKRMVQTAAHLTDYVFPRLPVRQWVLAVPKRVRYFLQNNNKIAGAVLKIFLRVLNAFIKKSSPLAPKNAKIGAVSFLQRFGSLLNQHFHYHCCVIDGVFAADVNGDVQFYENTEFNSDAINDFTDKVRKRILSYLVRDDYLDEYDADEMLQWDYNGGFSIDSSVRIEDYDRFG